MNKNRIPILLLPRILRNEEMFTKTSRYLTFLKCFKSFVTPPAYIQRGITRKLHRTTIVCAKLFVENENKYAFNIMANNGYVIGFNVNNELPKSLTEENFNSILEKNWSKESPQTVFKTFSALSEYCSKHNICISNKQLDNFIDTLTDNIKFAADEELKLIFYDLAQFPESESVKTRNFIEVWAALDDECFTRIKNWSIDELFSFMSLFYLLQVTKYSDFCRRCLLRFSDKAKSLTKSQVVQTLFFIGVMRTSPPLVHNLQIYIEEHFSKFSIDELGVIAMGLFKSKTPIRSMTLVTNIIEEVIKNSKEVNEIILAALLKIIRYSMKKPEDQVIYNLLDCLQHEIPRLSLMCNVQMALVGTATLTLHKQCLLKIAENTDVTTARIKDIERLVLTFATFNLRPNTKYCFLTKVLDELRKPDRQEEFKTYSKAFNCCVAYLTILGIYPFDLMNNILSPDSLLHTYGKHCYQYGREILTIHNVLQIFGGEEIINQIKDSQLSILAKKFTDYVPDEEYKKQYNVTEKMFLEALSILREVRGGKEFAIGHHILAHYQRGDILICNNENGQQLPVANSFEGIKFGLIPKPPDNNIWVALVIAGRNTIIKETSSPTGHFIAKVRELKAIGYKSAIVSWDIYNKLQLRGEKHAYLQGLINEAINT